MSDSSSQPPAPPPDTAWTLDVEAPAPTGPESAVELGRAYEALLERQGEETPPATMPAARAPAPKPEKPPEAAAPPPLHRVVEALLFVGGSPLTAARAGDMVRGLTAAQLVEAVDSLNRQYRSQGRPYHIEAHEQGFALVLRPCFRIVQDRLHGSAPQSAAVRPRDRRPCSRGLPSAGEQAGDRCPARRRNRADCCDIWSAVG